MAEPVWLGLPLQVEQVVTADQARLLVQLLRLLSFRVRLDGVTWTATAPAGWVTDLTSWPWWLPGRREGRHTPASIVHDRLYADGHAWMDGRRVAISRAQADRMYALAAASLGVGRVYRWMLHRAVRLGGGGPWRRARVAEMRERAIQLALAGGTEVIHE